MRTYVVLIHVLFPKGHVSRVIGLVKVGMYAIRPLATFSYCGAAK
jgi:hypothetical protein